MNVFGILGLVFAILGLLFFWLPYVDLVFSTAALLLSVIGIRRKPKGLAVVGLIIGMVDLALAVGFVFFYGVLFSWVGNWLDKLLTIWTSTC